MRIELQREITESLSDITFEIIFVIDLEFNVNFLNKEFLEFTGTKSKDFNSIFQEYIYSVDYHKIKNLLTSHKKPTQRKEFKISIKNDEGKYHIFQLRLKPHKDENNNIVSYVGIAIDIQELIEAEGKLIESERRFRAFQDIITDGFTIFSPLYDEQEEIIDFIYEYVNPAACRIVGMEPNDLLGKGLLQLFPSHKSGDNLFDIYKNVFLTGEMSNKEIYYEGEGISSWFRNVCIKVEGGIAVSYSDITRRKLLEFKTVDLLKKEVEARVKAEDLAKELEIAKEEYKVMGETVPFGVWKCKPNGDIIYISDSFCRMVGDSFENVKKQGWTEYLVPENKEITLKKWMDVISNGLDWDYEHKIINKDGNIVFVLTRGFPVKDENGIITSYVGINLDITERKKLEAKLEFALSEKEEILNRIQDSFFALDTNMNLMFANDKTMVFSTKEKKELLGKNLFESFPELKGSVIEEHYRYALEKQVSVTFDYNFVPNNVWLRVNVYPSLFGLTIYSTDLTQIKEKEKKLEAVVKEKELLLKEIHHRIKNNLQIVASLLSLQSNYITDELLLNKFKDSQNRIRTIAIVHEQLYNRKEFNLVDLKDYVKELIDKLFYTYNDFAKAIRINLHSDSEIKAEIEDAINIGLLINELVINSLKHAFNNSDNGIIDVIIIPEDGFIRLEVCDNGVGFQSDFDINTTESFGMQLVNALIMQMQGSFEVISDNGCKFIIKLKLKDIEEIKKEHTS